MNIQIVVNNSKSVKVGILTAYSINITDTPKGSYKVGIVT